MLCEALSVVGWQADVHSGLHEGTEVGRFGGILQQQLSQNNSKSSSESGSGLVLVSSFLKLYKL